MKEIWKDIAKYEGLYQISNFGKVKSLDRQIKTIYGVTRNIKGKSLTLIQHEDGYLVVALCKNNKVKISSVHRLVASAFIEKESGKPLINHKNGIKSDNTVSNLEWCTPRENIIHARDVLGVDYKTFKNKPVKRSDGKVFQSVSDAAIETGCSRRNLWSVLKGKRNKTYGYSFEYVEECEG
jgi:hypothetical protein